MAGLDGLVGRDATLTAVRDLLDSDGRTVVVTGIPGAGKTSLLAVVGRALSAEGRLVLSLTCHQSDRDLAFGALVDVLTGAPGAEDVLDLLVSGPDRPAAVDPLRLRLEVLAWLERTSDSQPVVLLVDDAQWCDESSRSVLGFVAHRLAGSRASLLVASRDDVSLAPFHRHPQVALPPLSDEDARALLRHAGILLDMLVLPSVLERAAGNPLALLELGRASVAGTDTHALPSSVERAFHDQLATLSLDTRKALLLATACDGDLRVLGRAVDPAELLAALAPAEEAGLVAVSEGMVRFRHPLVRSAVYTLATTSDRVSAHADLAAAYDGDPERQAWHRAEATVVPDESVAEALSAASDLALARGASSEASRLLVRASELSPTRAGRDERLLRAIVLGSMAGNFEWVARTGLQLRADSDDPAVRLRASHISAYALAQTDRTSAARRLLVGVLDQLKDADPFLGFSSLTTLAVLSYRTGTGSADVAEWLDVYDRAIEGAPVEHPDLLSAARAWIRVQIDPTSTPDDVLQMVRDAPVPEVNQEIAATHEMLLGASAWMLDEPVIAAERLNRSLGMMRNADIPGEMTQTLLALSVVQFALGEYDAADQSGRLVMDIAEARNQPYVVVYGREIRARVAAIRGDVEEARQLCEQVLLEIPAGEALGAELTMRVASSWIRMAEHDVQGAWHEVQDLFGQDGEPCHVHICYRELGTYASAALRVGAVAQLERVVAVAERRLVDPRPFHRIQLARVRALLAGEDAEPWHLEAVNHPEAYRWPWDHANARLEYGAWLRRRRRSTEARAQLQRALDTFSRLGTRAWSDLARAELRAAGVAVGDADPSGWADLTGQEREIVRLAATGMTNPEIAAALYLSPRTVSTHLYRAFPKLGVTARGQLRDVVAELT